MNKQTVSNFINTAKTTISKHSPEILVGIGIAGWCSTTIMAVKSTPKALRLLEDARHEKGAPLTKTEKVKTTWKCYVPAAVTGVVSTACLIGASSVSGRRNAALATAYQLSANALTEYKEKVVEVVGEKKEKTIREQIAQDKVEKIPMNEQTVIVTGSGSTLFVEPVSGRTFESDIETVRKVINDLNYRMVVGMEEYISLSELYDELGLARTSVSDDLGWNIGKDGQIEYDLHTCVASNGKPAFMLDYHVAPRRRYMDLM